MHKFNSIDRTNRVNKVISILLKTKIILLSLSLSTGIFVVEYKNKIEDVITKLN